MWLRWCSSRLAEQCVEEIVLRGNCNVARNLLLVLWPGALRHCSGERCAVVHSAVISARARGIVKGMREHRYGGAFLFPRINHLQHCMGNRDGEESYEVASVDKGRYSDAQDAHAREGKDDCDRAET
jgi:hypothetical protein